MFRILAATIVSALTIAPVPAAADVLEIGESGAAWVAGGPVSAEIVVAPLEVTATPPDVTGIAEIPLALTAVREDAGPAQWRARVRELAAKYDISPTLLEAVVWQESRWNPSARSPVGARGLAQLMPGTAAMMGVNPDDPLANLEGGARYLRMQLDTFSGNIELALAAYNAGPGRVKRAGGIPRIRETQDYVANILARLSEPVRK